MKIDPMLGWGYWLRIEPTSRGDMVVDDEGREWPSMRDAFWRGRLGMPALPNDQHLSQMEFMHRYISAQVVELRDRHREISVELFHGDHLLERTYRSFLVGFGLMAEGRGEAVCGELTAEGLSVLRMLDATRPYDVRHLRPSRASIDALMAVEQSPDLNGQRLDDFETHSQSWNERFARRDIGHSPAIILVARSAGPQPVMKTVWSTTFEDVALRDRFFGWLCARADRWPDWARKAMRYPSTDQLSTHLISVVLASSDVFHDAGSVGRRSV